MTTYVYDLSDPRTGMVRYIGKSVKPSERLTSHIKAAENGDRVHCRRWIAGLLQVGLRPVLSVLEEVQDAAANEAERFWIASFKLMGADLTNLTPGGDGQPRGFRVSQEAREKISRANTGRKKSPEELAKLKAAFSRPEVVQKRREIMLGRMADPELRAIAQQGMSGKKMSEEAKAKISAAWTPERKAKHAAEKSALEFDERWRQQLKDALAKRWAVYRAKRGMT